MSLVFEPLALKFIIQCRASQSQMINFELTKIPQEDGRASLILTCLTHNAVLDMEGVLLRVIRLFTHKRGKLS